MSIRSQGLVFSALAWLSLAVSLILPTLEVQAQLALLAPIILLLGVPHGALDIVYVRQAARIRSASAWTLFTIAYLAAAAAVMVVWWIAPGVFLVVFLVISALHFSGDPQGAVSPFLRTLYGVGIILCPLALHSAEVYQLFAALAGEAAAKSIITAMQWAAWPCVAAIGLAAIIGVKEDLARSIELVSVTALLVCAPPLIGFTIFFCCMHSARHVLRTRDYSDAGTLSHLARIASWPMLATFIGVVIAWWLSGGKPVDTRIAQVLFVGLAALTVPHMIVVERVRLTGWAMGRSTSKSSIA